VLKEIFKTDNLKVIYIKDKIIILKIIKLHVEIERNCRYIQCSNCSKGGRNWVYDFSFEFKV